LGLSSTTRECARGGICGRVRIDHSGGGSPRCQHARDRLVTLGD
jgi:hypothetical protein